MEADIRKLADELIDSFVGDGRVEFHDAFAEPLPCTIFLSVFGMPLEDFDFLVGSKDRILKNEGTKLEEHEAIGNEAGDRLREHLLMRLEERRREGFTRDDLIGRFMTFEVEDERLVRRRDRQHHAPVHDRRARHGHLVAVLHRRLAGPPPGGASPGGR